MWTGLCYLKTLYPLFLNFNHIGAVGICGTSTVLNLSWEL